MSGISVAFAGVAHSHPFADAANLLARGATVSGVWEADDPGRGAAFADRFAAPRRGTLDALLDDRPDLVVATPRTPRAPAVLRACADAGVPVFFNKTVAAEAAGLAAFDEADRAGARVATSSVLRFAPAVRAFAERLAGARVRTVDVLAQHEIAGFLAPDRAWQDDPAAGGGTLLSIGVHAVDLADALRPGLLAGATPTDVWSTAAALPTRSETIALLRAETTAGIPVTLTVSGVDGPDRYALRVVADDGVHELALGDGDDLGYDGLADALVAFAAGGAAPVDWERSAAGYRLLLAAATRLRGGREAA